LSTIRIHSYP
ncbi:hypothetical protein CP02DC14_0084B, partial [Chlamydia psittaci 02DC14]